MGKTPSVPLELSRPAPGKWLALDHLVGQDGEGGTPEDAMRDLVASLRESCDLLRARRRHLSPALSRQLAALEDFFGPE